MVQKKSSKAKQATPKKAAATTLFYPVTYSLRTHNPPLAEGDIPDGWDGCTAMATLLYYENDIDGEASYGVGGVDKDGKAMKPEQLFQMWHILAEHLSQTLTHKGPRLLCESVTQLVQKAIQNERLN